jgi:hypothetical protein
MRLVQLIHDGKQCVARVVDHDTLEVLPFESTYALTMAAMREGVPLQDMVLCCTPGTRIDYQAAIDEKRLLPPLTHPDPAHMLVSGTGLTHLGSADTRNAMHAGLEQKEEALTDSMKMFKLGVEGGKPPQGAAGAQPEWFYKGDGSIVVAPETAIPVPPFAQDAGEEPELVGLYVIDGNGQPRRIGFAIGNEFSDHVTERYNYLWLAHSKLRYCSFGPELLVGDAPEHIEGISRISRDGTVLWEKPFLTGERNMSHTLANLEHHHFKYAQFCRPGDVHAHFFGTATLSFADGVRTQPGDVFEIGAPALGRPLRNPIDWNAEQERVAEVRRL